MSSIGEAEYAAGVQADVMETLREGLRLMDQAFKAHQSQLRKEGKEVSLENVLDYERAKAQMVSHLGKATEHLLAAARTRSSRMKANGKDRTASFAPGQVVANTQVNVTFEEKTKTVNGESKSL